MSRDVDGAAREVDQIKRKLPSIRASIPSNEQLLVTGDLTTTIRASVKDVEGTLVLSIGLVVFVVFLFLRNARATLIPGVAVTVSVIGTFAVMYLCGYTLDNYRSWLWPSLPDLSWMTRSSSWKTPFA
jgi:multidrug efflux pump